MSTLVLEGELPKIADLKISDDTLTVNLNDGRTISVPLEWFPRLIFATVEERNNWRLIGQGLGIHWIDVDEDISVDSLIAGKPSGESQVSFKKWLETRKTKTDIPQN